MNHRKIEEESNSEIEINKDNLENISSDKDITSINENVLRKKMKLFKNNFKMNNKNNINDFKMNNNKNINDFKMNNKNNINDFKMNNKNINDFKMNNKNNINDFKMNNNINDFKMNNKNNNNINDFKMNKETSLKLDERIKNGINNIFSGPDFLSDEMIKHAKMFQSIFFEEFLEIKCNNLVEKIEKMKIQGDKFIDIFMLFCFQKNVFERYWEDFFDIPLYIKEKKEVLESVPIDWVIEHIEDKPKSKKFLLVYEKPEIMNGLKKYIIRYEDMLYDFFCKLIERSPKTIVNLLSQNGFDTALEKDTPLGRKLILEILEVGGLGYVNEKNIGFFSEEQIELCYKDDYKNYLNDEIVVVNDNINFKKGFKEDKSEENDFKSEENDFKSEENISFDGDIYDLSS